MTIYPLANGRSRTVSSPEENVTKVARIERSVVFRLKFEKKI